MKLSVRTFNDKERLLRFSTFVGLHRIGLWICLGVVSAMVCVPFVLQFTGGGFDGKVTFSFVLISLFDIFYLFTYFVLPRLTIDKMPLLGVTIDFTFLDSLFIMSASSKNGVEESTFRYTDLHGIKEGKEELYLYITKSQAFIVDKTALDEETLKALKDHIKSKMTPQKA